jgi:hypothetical protein
MDQQTWTLRHDVCYGMPQADKTNNRALGKGQHLLPFERVDWPVSPIHWMQGAAALSCLHEIGQQGQCATCGNLYHARAM